MILKLGSALVMVGFLVLAVSSVCCAEEQAAPAATPMTKLGNGLLNTVTGWMEVPRNISEVSTEQNAFVGITYGLAKGACYGTGRTAAGVLDAGTFLFPPYDKPIMQPNAQF